MSSLVEKLNFFSMGTAFHPEDAVNAKVHLATTKHYVYTAYAVSDEVTFYLFNRVTGLLERFAEYKRPLFTCRHNFRLDKEIPTAPSSPSFHNDLNLNYVECAILHANMVKYYRQQVWNKQAAMERAHTKLLEVRKQRSITREPALPASRKRALSDAEKRKKVEAFLDAYKIKVKDTTLQTREKPKSPTPSPSPAQENLRTLDQTIALKDSVLTSFHLLTEAERKDFQSLWNDFEVWMELHVHEAIQLSSTSPAFKHRYQKIKSIHEQLDALHQNIESKRMRPQMSPELLTLLSEIKSLKYRIRQEESQLEVVSEHQFATITKDVDKLLDLYHHASLEELSNLDGLVLEGLTEAATKLRAVAQSLAERERKAIERQVMLLRER